MTQFSPAPDRLTLRRPDDWHVHLRDGDVLKAVVRYTARQFGRAIVMPNLSPPITTVAAARAYRERILAALAESPAVLGGDGAVGDVSAFVPLMTCYLTDDISPDEVVRGHQEGVFTAAKLYPANATTNSAHGVTNVRNIYSVLERMQEIGMPLLIHGEVTDADIDIFDREAVFIDRTMSRLVADFPALKVVFEHITTEDAAQFVLDAPATVGATITPHHLEISRNAMLVGGIRPHYYCLPIVKRERHRQALRKAATGGNAKFFLGTDTAPHARNAKETGCGCAGIFNAPHALEAYAKVFEEEDALDRLEAFASENGPRFYGLPLNESTVTLERAQNAVPETLPGGEVEIVPFHAGSTLSWRLASS